MTNTAGSPHTDHTFTFAPPVERLTPREEFEANFGPIDDAKWQGLKEFCERNFIPQKQVDHGHWCTGCLTFEADADFTGAFPNESRCLSCGCDAEDHHRARVMLA